jgi:hypothetical protein
VVPAAAALVLLALVRQPWLVLRINRSVLA